NVYPKRSHRRQPERSLGYRCRLWNRGELAMKNGKKSVVFYRPNGDIKGVGTILLPHLEVSMPAMEGICGDKFPQLRLLKVETGIAEPTAVHDYRVENEKLALRRPPKQNFRDNIILIHQLS